MSTHGKIPKSFGAKVRKLRTKIGLSQEKLGFKTRLDRTYISGIERGVRNPSIKNVEKIADALKVSISELFS